MIQLVRNPSAVLKAAEWFLNSGIQNLGRDRKLKGGVAAWYDLYRRLYPFLYSEITGYSLTLFSFLDRIFPERVFLERAELGAQWLVRNAFRLSGGVRTRLYLVKGYETPNYSFKAGRVYAFDSAMAGYGLIELYRRRPHPIWRDHIEKVWEFLTRVIRLRGSNFYPYYEASQKRCGEDLSKWSDQAGSFHAKLANFFLEYHDLTGKGRARAIAKELLDGILRLQESDGRFVTNRRDGSTHLHPHLYTLEGLVYGALRLGNQSYLQAAVRGMQWAGKAVSRDGSVSAIFESGRFAFHERSDIVAQFLRLESILRGLGVKKAGADAGLLKKMRDHLLLFQFTENGIQQGGFLYGSDTDGRMRIHLNAWASMFAIQALWMYEEVVEKRKKVDLTCFV